MKIFKELDVNGDGVLTRDELIEGFKKFYNGAQILAENEADDIMKKADLNGNGEIDYTEWIIATNSRNEMFDDSRLKIAFEFFDKDNSGTISREELRNVMKDKMVTD